MDSTTMAGYYCGLCGGFVPAGAGHVCANGVFGANFDVMESALALRERAEQAEKRVEELEADKRRLDYIEANTIVACERGAGEPHEVGDLCLAYHGGLMRLESQSEIGLRWVRTTWRAAIDAAMKGEKA